MIGSIVAGLLPVLTASSFDAATPADHRPTVIEHVDLECSDHAGSDDVFLSISNKSDREASITGITISGYSAITIVASSEQGPVESPVSENDVTIAPFSSISMEEDTLFLRAKKDKIASAMAAVTISFDDGRKLTTFVTPPDRNLIGAAHRRNEVWR
jgi:hypothetical protein